MYKGVQKNKAIDYALCMNIRLAPWLMLSLDFAQTLNNTMNIINTNLG